MVKDVHNRRKICVLLLRQQILPDISIAHPPIKKAAVILIELIICSYVTREWEGSSLEINVSLDLYNWQQEKYSSWLSSLFCRVSLVSVGLNH